VSIRTMSIYDYYFYFFISIIFICSPVTKKTPLGGHGIQIDPNIFLQNRSIEAVR